MFPRWLSWLLLAVMGYLLFVGGVGRPPQPTPHPTTEASAPDTSVPVVTETNLSPDAAQYPHIAAATDIERWKRSINPDYAAKTQCSFTPATDGKSLTLKAIEEVSGTGEGAKCGETIRTKIIVWNAHGTTLYTGETDLALGSREVAAGLDAALLGLRVGGTRTVILPPEALVHEEKTPAAKVLLNALRPNSVNLVTVTRTP